MKIYKIFDNGGKSWDRYTLLTEPYKNGISHNAFAFSINAKSPQGFNQFVGDVYEEADIGREVSADDLPDEVKQAIFERIL